MDTEDLKENVRKAKKLNINIEEKIMSKKEKYGFTEVTSNHQLKYKEEVEETGNVKRKG